jgi:hypothetical protein
MPIRALTMTGTLRLPVPTAPKDLKIPQRVIADQDYIGTTPPVAPIGAATRNMGLTAKRDRPVATGACLDEYACAILKHERANAAENQAWQGRREAIVLRTWPTEDAARRRFAGGATAGGR